MSTTKIIILATTVLLIACVAAANFLIQQWKHQWEEFDMELTSFQLTMLAFSDFVTMYWYVLIIIPIAACFFLMQRFGK